MPQPDWAPTTPFERAWADALRAGEVEHALEMLLDAELGMPLTGAAGDGTAAPAWATVTGPPPQSVTAVLVYTSEATMVAALGGRTDQLRAVTLPELTAGWPDGRWSLVVNLGTPASLTLTAAQLARLTAPSMQEVRDAVPDAELPVVQKVLSPDTVRAYLEGATPRVSGYVHVAGETLHIATPRVLLDALALPHSLLGEQEEVWLLRWAAVGPQLYPVPYGGTDDERCAAVDGWVVEEAPFPGLGFVPNVDRVLHEYKVTGVALPHGSELWRLTAEGRYERRAVLDTDRGRWLVTLRPEEADALSGRSGGTTAPRLSAPSPQDPGRWARGAEEDLR